MKVLQSIVARTGTDVEAIKAAFEPDVQEALCLTAPSESGRFIVYEQGPREAFKSDSLEVVVLKDDNSLLGIQGELLEPEQSFIVRAANLFKAKKQEKYIGTDDGAPIEADVLKSRLSNEMWAEIAALRDALSGILEQQCGSSQSKVDMCKTVCQNFLASLEFAVTALKCDSFDFASFREASPPADQQAEKQAEKSVEAPASDPVSAPVSPAPESPAVIDADAVVAKATEEALKVVKTIVDAAIKPLADTVKSVQEEVVKMQKAPTSTVRSSADDELPVQKGEKDSVFAGCFGNLARRQA
jgi:hypothetical protein